MQTLNRSYFTLAGIAVVLAFCVILLGAYTRLKDAGLGCPDWPGCYGQLTVPHTTAAIQKADQLFPQTPVEPTKAWAEMVHRYFAGSLGLLIFALAVLALIRKPNRPEQPLFIPLLLVAVVIFQAALGMWTVTLKLLPLVVIGHLLGGMTILALLWWLMLKSGGLMQNNSVAAPKLRSWSVIGLLIVAGQIFLGGWTTANYASLACHGFPACNGIMFPPMDLHSAFNFFSPIGTDYQGGVLNMATRVTIQMAHRYGALITAVYIGGLSIYLMSARQTAGLRLIGFAMMAILIVQIILGVLNVELMLPLTIAVAHNGFAALLLVSVITLVYKVYAQQRGMV
jgi:cytochrome c oxidase assembly protein subunit 15